MLNKRIIFALLIVVIIGFGGFLYYRSKVFSKEILKLEILSQDKAKMGDEVEYTVKYKNNGNFVLENPKLVFELPANSLREDSQTRFTQNLEDIYPGEGDIVKFSGRLLGKEEDVKTAKAWLSYKPRNLSVRYESETSFATKINSVPITLTYDLPSKVEKGKEVNYSINYFSNIDYPLENLSIKIEPLPGFGVKSADPASLDNAEWNLKVLEKFQGGRIKIKGYVSADPESQLSFSARLGMWQDGSFIIIKEASQDVQVIQPLLFISELINGVSNYVASPGQTLNYQIFIRNIGSTPFDNLFVMSRLEGEAFDLSTLKSDYGQARQNDNLIIFDSKQIPELQRLGPQREVKVEFSVKLKDSWNMSELEKNNAVVKNKVNVFDISEEFTTKVSSKLDFSQKVYRTNFDGIENSGPIPPEAGKTTTYVVNWQVKNYLNDIKNIKVKAILPQSVGLNDNIAPESQAYNFSFDSQSREIVWSAGDLKAGNQISLSFQVVLTPGSWQKGSLANLIGQATIFAEDQFTGSGTQITVSGIDTSLPDDRNNSGGGIVQ